VVDEVVNGAKTLVLWRNICENLIVSLQEASMDYVRPNGMASSVIYRDARAAIEWLVKAFGFEVSMIVENEDGSIGHSELRLGDGLIYVGYEFDERHRSPAALGNVNTQSLSFHLAGGLDEHFARAKAAGATVLREPADQFYGDRNYMVADPEGHVWGFSQTVKTMTFEEMAQAGKVAVRETL
jgi:uncharacterized glyoxalase superfamily protein PhnB